ncbi:MAG TPA: glycerol-3-phosphate 1-O-acyltransferase PlsY [Gemmatimonadota bacterium]|nr:glycerol-3-phosphate 1-O-acyltransferase PlsY [Gemmatimonadota bacterium]
MSVLIGGVLVAYLAGSFPTAWLAGRALGMDLGKAGSGNYGATNVFRNLGPAAALAVLVVDVGKGFFPVFLLPRVWPAFVVDPVVHGVLLAVAAVLGHVYSVFLGFRGGKGIGTAAGAYLALAPWAFLCAAAAWGLIVAVTRLVSLASLAGAVILLVAVAVTDFGSGMSDTVLTIATALLVIFVFWTHRANIGRLSRGDEKRIAPGGPGRAG